MQNIQGKTRRQRMMERVLGDMLRVGCFLQRISASDSNFRSGKGEWFRLQTATTPRLH